MNLDKVSSSNFAFYVNTVVLGILGFIVSMYIHGNGGGAFYTICVLLLLMSLGTKIGLKDKNMIFFSNLTVASVVIALFTSLTLLFFGINPVFKP